MDAELKEFLGRITTALESIADEPVVHVESGPPVCPGCETMNPKIVVRESEASGPLGEYVLQAHCQHCQEIFYAIPQMWLTVRSISEVEAELQARRERGNS